MGRQRQSSPTHRSDRYQPHRQWPQHRDPQQPARQRDGQWDDQWSCDRSKRRAREDALQEHGRGSRQHRYRSTTVGALPRLEAARPPPPERPRHERAAQQRCGGSRQHRHHVAMHLAAHLPLPRQPRRCAHATSCSRVAVRRVVAARRSGEGTLRAREEELAQNMLELRALRAELRESPPKLTRTPRGLRAAYAYPPPLRAVGT